jgi:hypothetical protein
MKRTSLSSIKRAALIVATSALLAPSAHAISWVQWSTASGGNDHWYGLTDAAGTWLGARTEALSAYAGSATDLVAINSAAEQAFLTGAFGGSGYLWIGLSDQATEGNWSTWSNGEAVTYSNWSAGEPNDYQPAGGEDFAAMNWGQSGLWNDLSGDPAYPNRGIVERVDPVQPPTNGVPDGGASAALLGSAMVGLAFLRRRQVTA